jgi:outer membrane protein assembly factor BamD (BamD/ComL family)
LAFVLALVMLAGAMGATGATAAGTAAKAKLVNANALFAQKQYEKAAVAYLEASKTAGADAATIESAQLGAIRCLCREKAYDAFRSAGEAFLKARSAKAAETNDVRQLKLTLAMSWFEQGKHAKTADMPGDYAKAAVKLGDYIAAHKADAQCDDASATQKLFDAASTRAVALQRSGAGGGRALLLEYSNKFSNPELAGRLKLQAAGFLRDAGDKAGFRRDLTAITKGNWSAGSRLAFDAQLELARAAADQDGLTSAATILGNYVDQYPNSKWAFKAAAQRYNWLIQARRHDDARAAMQKFATTHAGTPEGVEASFQATLSLYEAGKYSDFLSEGTTLRNNNSDYQGALRDDFDFRTSEALFETKNWPEAVDRLAIFINDYPNYRMRDEAKVFLGASRIKLGQIYASENNATSATAQQALGQAMLKAMIVKLDSEVTSKTKSLASLRATILYAHYYAGDYDGLAAEAQKLADEQTTHSLLWARATFWHGVALRVKSPPDLDGAAADFDAVLDSGVTDDDLKIHIPSLAALWRTTVAGDRNDKRALTALKPKILALPDGAQKSKALERWQEASSLAAN